MILVKLYSLPAGLFTEIKFRERGVNFIYGKKDTTDSKKSLNSIGKSCVIDLINFCMLSNVPPRLKQAKEKNIFDSYSVALDFKINSTEYTIIRDLNKDKQVQILTPDNTFNFDSKDDAKQYLCDLIFLDPKYSGKYSNSWLRSLISFFIKVHDSKHNFSDPIKYTKAPVAELMIYHLFFLNIDNIFSYENWQYQVELKKKQDSIKEINDIIKDTYDLKDITEVTKKLDIITKEVVRFENEIKSFKLAKQYESTEEASNKITKQIKELVIQNYTDREALSTYRESYQLKIDFNPKKIVNIYKKANEILGEAVRKSLDEAIQLKEEISKSRKKFLSKEVKRLEDNINRRNEEIESLEKNRANLFNFLSTENAIHDLSEAYLQIQEKQKKISELNGKVGIYKLLEKEEAALDAEIGIVYSNIVSLITESKETESSLRAIFIEIFNQIYTEQENEANFSIIPNKKKKQKIDILIDIPGILSKGKYQAATVLYDLMVLFSAIENKRNMPKFLIHDGIFDGIDKAQFVHLYNHLNDLAKFKDFQYIVTLNEEGTLIDENFGYGAEELTSQRIEKEAIIVLTPNEKLFGCNF